MKFNKLMLFSIIMIAILAIGAVSATDLDSVDDIESNDFSIDDSLSVESDSNNGDAGAEGDNQQVNPKNDNNNHVTVPENVYPWDFNVVVDIPDDADGTFDISFNETHLTQSANPRVDEVLKNNKTINLSQYINGQSTIEALTPGENYSLTISYTALNGDVNFNETHNFYLNYIKFEVPEEISTKSYGQELNIFTPLGDTGKGALFLDGKQIYAAELYDAIYYSRFRVDNDFFKEFGEHTYELKYSDGKYPNASQTGTINVIFYDMLCPDVILKGDYPDYIEVNMPFDAFGTLKLIVDGKELVPRQNFDRQDETTYGFDLSSLDCKEYNATLVYSGDSYYPAFNRTVSFKLDYLVDICPDSYTDNKNVSDEIYLDLPVDFPAGATFTLTVNGTNYTATTVKDAYNTKAFFDISNLTAGEYDANLTYNGDSKYPAKTIGFKFNKFYKVHFNNWHDIFEDTYVTLNLPEEANGNLSMVVINGSNNKSILNVTVNVKEYEDPGNGINYTINPKDGFKLINCTIPNTVLKLTIPESNYFIFNYTGDYQEQVIDSYFPSIDTDPAYISIYPRMNLPIVYAGKDANFTFEMPSDANGRLLVLLGGKTYYNGTLKDGKATFKLPTTQVGAFDFYYEYTGDTKYGDSRTDSEPSEFTVKGKIPTINITKPTYFVKNCNNVIKFTFHGTSFNGNLKLKLDYGNSRYEYITVPIVKGVGSVNIVPKYQGKVRIYYNYAYKYYATYGFDECLGDFKVYKLTSKNVTKYYTDSKKLNVTIVDNHNKPVPNGQVVYFYYKGKKIGNATTKNGVASFKLNYRPGTYIIKVYYKGTYVNRKVIIKPILTFKAVKVKRSARKLVLTASLKKVNGKYLKGKYVTFKFNGKTYKAKTNSKGVAKVTIKRTVLKKLRVGKKIKIQATYLKDTVKRTAKVKR